MVRPLRVSSSSGWNSLWTSPLTANCCSLVLLSLTTPSSIHVWPISPCLMAVLHTVPIVTFGVGSFFFCKDPIGIVLGPSARRIFVRNKRVAFWTFPYLLRCVLGVESKLTMSPDDTLRSVHPSCSLKLVCGTDLSFWAHLNCFKFSPGILI